MTRSYNYIITIVFLLNNTSSNQLISRYSYDVADKISKTLMKDGKEQLFDLSIKKLQTPQETSWEKLEDLGAW